MESKLYERFMASREKGQAIRREWFRRHSMEIFLAEYPNTDRSIFKCSNGWFAGFLDRYKISLRAVTKKAQKVSNLFLLNTRKQLKILIYISRFRKITSNL